jgi:hypothetical protein
MGYRSALDDYWESQRAAHQESAQDRVHAWYGNHGGYYPSQFRTPTVPFGRDYSTYSPAAYGGCRGQVPGDLCFDYDCDSLELIDYDELCGDLSRVDCLKALHHTGRR